MTQGGHGSRSFALALMGGLAAMPSRAAYAQPPVAAHAPGEYAYSVASKNAVFTVLQNEVGAKGCRLEVQRADDSSLVWGADRCFGEKEDFKFVSDDGEELMVIYSYPAHPKGAKVGTAIGAQIFARGKLKHSVSVGELLHDLAKAKDSGTHVRWLGGAAGMPGVPPRYSEDGAGVSVELIDGRTRKISFSANEDHADKTKGKTKGKKKAKRRG